jgi:DNA-directed RNA polymerase specialized sigma24 family protein
MSQLPQSPIGPQFGTSPEAQVTGWIVSSFEDVSEQVGRWCCRYLPRFNHADVSAEDARQNVLAKILCLRFAEHFNPDKGTIMQFIHGVTRHECLRMIQLHYRKIGRQRELLDDATTSLATGPDLAAQLAEFVEALNRATNELTVAERSALPDVLGTEFSWPPGPKPCRSTRLVRAFRCRRRLASELVRFRPG